MLKPASLYPSSLITTQSDTLVSILNKTHAMKYVFVIFGTIF